MDIFGKRAKLLIDYPDIIDASSKKKKQNKEGQTSLFGDDEPINNPPKASSSPDFEDFSMNDKLAFEKEFLGFYLTAHPQLDNLIKLKAKITHEIELLEEEKEEAVVTVGGIIEAMRRIFTKKTGKEMAFITIANENGVTLECVVFPRVFDTYRSILTKESVVIITGKLDSKNEKPVVIADRIQVFGSFSS